MLVRYKNDLLNTDQHAVTDIWTSLRYLVKDDKLGFSLHETVVEGGTEQELWYKNHIEAVIITEGVGQITDLSTGISYHLEPGVAYALQGEKHIFKAITKMVCYCVFLPGLSGKEVPDEDGSYPAK